MDITYYRFKERKGYVIVLRDDVVVGIARDLTHAAALVARLIAQGGAK